MQYVALAWLVLQLTNSPLMLGIVGLVQSAPNIALVFVGGTVADRVDRRRLLVLTQGLTALLFGSLGLLVMSGLVEIWHVLVIAFLLGSVRAFDQPSRQGLLPLLVPRAEIPLAIPLGNLAWQTSRLVGPATAGLLIYAVGVGPTLLAAAAGFATAMCLFSFIRVAVTERATSEGGFVSNVLEGLDFIRRNDLFYTLLGMTFFNSVFGMSYAILMPVMARDVLHVGSQGFGFMQAAGGIGALVGTVIVARLAHSRQRGRQILLGGGAFGLLIVVFAFSPAYAFALGALFLMGGANQIYMTTVNTTLQLELPDEFRGRVMGVWGLTWSLMPLGGTIAGTIAQYGGPQIALAIGGALVTGMAVLVALAFPRVRQLA
jgi:MFS family permease